MPESPVINKLYDFAAGPDDCIYFTPGHLSDGVFTEALVRMIGDRAYVAINGHPLERTYFHEVICPALEKDYPFDEYCNGTDDACWLCTFSLAYADDHGEDLDYDVLCEGPEGFKGCLRFGAVCRRCGTRGKYLFDCEADDEGAFPVTRTSWLY